MTINDYYIRLKAGISKLLSKDIALRVISLVIAVIAWLFVTLTLYPTDTTTIAGIPVKIDLEGSAASVMGLTDVAVSVENVTATVEGKRVDIVNLKAATLTAVVNIDSVTNSGTRRLEYDIVSSDDTEFTVMSVDPPYITVEFDKIITKEVPVAAVSTAETAEGYIPQTPVCSPETITLTGPQQQISKIEKCMLSVGSPTKLTDTLDVVTSEYRLTDKNGTTVTVDESVEMSSNSFAVTVPVFIERVVKLKVDILNKPEYFDLENLSYELSTPEITIDAPVGENYDGNIGYINMQDIDIGYSKTFKITLPEGYINISGVEEVTVTFNTDNLARKTLTTFTRLINMPDGYKVDYINSGYSVVYVGPADDIASLASTDVVAYIDMRNYEIQEGLNTNVPVTVVIPNNDKIWSYGTYTATVKAVKLDE